MNVILLAGYKEPLQVALTKVNGLSWIDFQIQRLLDMNFNVVTVLGYNFADDILSNSHLIQKTEMIFDTNNNPNWMTNLKSGLYTFSNYGFALPLETLAPGKFIWDKLIESYYKHGSNHHIIQGHAPLKGKMKAGFPILISEFGRDFLIERESQSTLNDKDLKALKVPFISSEILYKCSPNNLKNYDQEISKWAQAN